MVSGTNPSNSRLTAGTLRSGKVLALNRLVLLTAVPLFLVLVVVTYLTVQFAINERRAQGLVRHTHQVMEVASRLQNELQVAESAQRGFLLDRDPEYYNVYQAAAARVPGHVTAFRQITRDNPSQQQRADRLQSLVQGRLALLADNVKLATSPDPD